MHKQISMSQSVLGMFAFSQN